ncbi:hypothetical protein [uncultured Bacteroides sp.]|uniref:hypothetical protein n=1 Tax=uncultured Bacteroides sp. TaxID=162156 RepID=UPI002AA5F3F5|nr:hypothetical protein [uncultured Bacteroides sp.]
MKLLNNLFLVLAGITVFTLTACGDDDNYSPGEVTNEEGLNVYFEASNNSSPVLGPTDTEFTLTVSRNKKGSAISVPLEVSKVYADLFTVPSSVDFEADEDTKTITIKVSDKMEMFTSYHLALSLDPSYTLPYVSNPDAYPNMELNIVKEDYAPYAEGTYISEGWETNENVTLEYSEILDNYRLKSCWGEGTGNVVFTWDGTSEVKLVTTSIPTGLIDSDYGAVTVLESDENPCTYDGATKTFTFPLEWTVSAGSYGVYNDFFTIESMH